MSSPVPPVSTIELAAVLTDARRRVPEQVLRSARLHLLDALGVGMLGAARGPVRGVTSLASAAGGVSSVPGQGRCSTSATAALVNGALIHSLEFDDTHVPSVMHGSSVLAASALAVAEEVGADGGDLLEAFAVGWEFLIRIGLASPGRIQARGFQITSAAGAFAAAAVSCLLHQDTPATFSDALGIAGSQAAGTFAFLADGATVKAVQPGWAAHAGVLAAELARAGVSGPGDVFGGRYGFYALYAGDDSAPRRLVEVCADLGTVWHLPDAAFKLVPCCHYIHPFVEGMLDLMARGMTMRTLVGLHCRVPLEAVPVIADGWPARQRPASPHDARWSLPYVLAAVLRDSQVDVAVFDGAACDDELMALAGRMTFEPWVDSGFPARFPARMSAELADGSRLAVTVEDVLGSAGRPVSTEVVRAKAEANLTGGGLSAAAAASLAAEILDSPAPRLGPVGRLLRRECDG